jgi:hypothetical protein
VNQINVHPLFKLNLSILNSFTITPSKYRKIDSREDNSSNYISQDQFKKDLVSKILDLFTIRQPNLVINDLFFILEGAGPYIYKDSKIKKTGLMVIGNDAILVDQISLKLLKLKESSLLEGVKEKNLTLFDPSNIKILGEKLDDNEVDIDLCVSKIQDLKVNNICIKSGKYCSGCFLKAYHLLNFMKTHLRKDLKYNVDNSFLIGDDPPEPENKANILLFGDCAVNSTIDHNFRRLIIESNKNKALKKKKKSKPKQVKVKEKVNKKILELPGCPPKLYSCLKMILKYFGKKNCPNLNFFVNSNEFWIKGKMNENLNLWEGL